jgi:hypothetical protein
MPKRVISNNIEVSGRSIMSILNGMEMIRTQAMKLLAENGIQQLEQEGWYPLQNTLKSYQAVFEKVGPVTLKAVGRKIPESATFPPQIDSLEAALRSIHTAYHMNHRGQEGSDIGGYHYESEGPRKGRMVCDNLYPCELDQGIIEAMFKRFPPKDSSWVRIDHDPSGCRARGATACTYHLTW